MALYSLNSFDEAYYVQNNPDVLQAIIGGAFSSGLQHYQLFGEAEGRKPNAAFDPFFYYTQNPDVLTAVSAGQIPGALWHFENFGVNEGRQPSAAVVFDESWYLDENPDVAAAVAAGDFASGWQHWVLFGAEESREPSEAGVAGQVFALTDGKDVIPGLIGSEGSTSTVGTDVIKGNSSTFGEGDSINAGDGVDTLTLVLNEADTAYAGVFVANVENFELRSIATMADDDAVVVSMTQFDGALQSVKIYQSTGDTIIQDLQANVDVVIDDVAGNVEIDFDNQNAPTELNVSVNEFGTSAGADWWSELVIDEMVDTVNISDDAAGAGFYNDFGVYGGFSELNVTGGAVGTGFYIGAQSTASTLDFDLTGNASDDKYVYVDMTEASQWLNLTVDGFSDVVEIDADGNDSVDADLGEGDNDLDVDGDLDYFYLMAGAGSDYVETDDVGYANIALGEGNNYLSMGDVSGAWWWWGGLDLVTGDGDDTVYTDDVNDANIDLGGGQNYLSMEDVGSLDLVTGDGNDTVYTDDFGRADINLGEGDNYLSIGDSDWWWWGNDLTLVTGDGNDTISTGDVWWSDIDLGNGSNYLYMHSAQTATIVTGDNDDSVTIDDGDNWWWWGSRDLDISLGGGDDFLDLSGNNWWWWGNGNGLETDSGVSDYHIIAGGDGDDTLRLANLDQADAADTFANVTSIETVQFDHQGWWWWSMGGGSLDGVTTGANAAGVVNYEFLNGNYSGEDITLTNVVNDVTVRMDLNEYYDAEGQNFTLTQTPDDDANVANVHFNLNDYYYWWTDDYFFGDITVDTTEVLNMSGDDYDYYWWYDNSLEISGLYSADLTTLNLSGDLEFDFWNMVAPNLSMVDASGMTDTADIELNDVADAVTVYGGTGDDVIILKDTASALTADGGDGDDYLEGNQNDDVLSGGAGNDVIYAASGIDEVHGDAGDDLILWDAAELFAVDIVDGGADYDTVELDGTLGVQNDSFFYQWSGVEKLMLDDGGNVLTLGIIASDAGLEEIHLSDPGDSLYLIEGWSNDTAIYLSPTGNDTVVEAPSVGVDLRVYAAGSQLTPLDTLDGGNGSDTLYLTADTAISDLSGVTNFETVMVVADADNTISILTADSTIATDATLTIDGRALVLGDYDGNPGTPDTTGTLSVLGSAETDGHFVVWGGDGGDFIYTGGGNDTVNAGEGDNTVETGAGMDSITTGSGADTVDGGDDDDVINTGAGDDTVDGGAGDDVIAAGDGANYIEGGDGADQMSGGVDADTFYFDADDAEFGNADIITGFNAGDDGTGPAPVDLFETWAAVTYLGEFANATLGLLALQANVGGVEAVLVNEIDGKYLYIDVDGSDAFDSTDAAIKLVGLTGTLDQTDFTV